MHLNSGTKIKILRLVSVSAQSGMGILKGSRFLNLNVFILVIYKSLRIIHVTLQLEIAFIELQVGIFKKSLLFFGLKK